jgi:dephospho-CoA kinase
VVKVGLTGGIACGKTMVLEMFASRGAHTMRADEVGHQLMMPGEKVHREIVARFGSDILNDDQTINRPRLATKAFAGRIDELNAIIHPAVIEAQDRWASEVGAREPGAVVIIEAALMVEAGAHKHMDKLVVVTCTLEQRVARFAKRAGISEDAARDEVNRRMKWQFDDEAKIKVADFVIDNSGTVAEAEAQVERIWQELQLQAARSAKGHESQ